MLKHLKLTNIGPADTELELGDRLNLITGDNRLHQKALHTPWQCVTLADK